VTPPPTRTIFFGSGPFALPALEALASDPAVELCAVVSTPARPAGRSGRPGMTPIAARALALGLPLQQPARLRDPAGVSAIRALRPELIVLADYGQLVPGTILDLPRHGALNLHPSLLPRHRGAAPIQAAILAGDAASGVTLMRMDEGLDSGPLVAQVRTPVGADETAPQLEARLAGLAAQLLREQLGGWLRGEVATRPQPTEGATMTRPLRREDGRLDPSRPAAVLARQVRALQPWPGTFTETQTGRLVLWAVEVLPRAQLPPDPPPGTLVADGDGLALVTGEDGLRLLEVQPAGGRRMSGAELRRGRPGLVGSRIGAARLR
jgi:methionyl-tRNA formyltransferase